MAEAPPAEPAAPGVDPAPASESSASEPSAFAEPIAAREAPAPPAATPGAASEPAAAPEPGGMVAAKALLAFVPPATLITALLFYFGWARTYAQARALGADASVFGYTTRDYMLRSVDSLYFPLIVLTALGLVALLGHQWVRGRLATEAADGSDPLLERTGLVLLIGGLAVTGFGILYATNALGRSRALDLLGPLALGAGVLVSAYGGWLRARARGRSGAGAWGQAPSSPWVAPVAAGLLLSIAALSIFWAVGNYALWRGQDLAVRIAATYHSRPSVVVYSATSLSLDGVETTHVDDPDARFPWRYSGLRLLDRVGTTYFLMPEDWSSRPRLILLDQTDDTRFELSPG